MENIALLFQADFSLKKITTNHCVMFILRLPASYYLRTMECNSAKNYEGQSQTLQEDGQSIDSMCHFESLLCTLK